MHVCVCVLKIDLLYLLFGKAMHAKRPDYNTECIAWKLPGHFQHQSIRPVAPLGTASALTGCHFFLGQLSIHSMTVLSTY